LYIFLPLQQAGPSFLSLGFFLAVSSLRGDFGSILNLKSLIFIFFSLFQSKEVISHRSDSYRKIHYLIKDLGVNVADPEVMDIPITLILSYIFVGIMSFYVINLEAVSLFADSSFTFLAVLNDVISRFE